MSYAQKKLGGFGGGLVAAAIIAAIVLINIRVASGGFDAASTWACTAGLVAAFIALSGTALNGRPAGILIDNRNRVSLSKFQATLWTVLVVSALVTISAARFHVVGFSEALEITIPGELLVAMGISAVSLVATPALLSAKTADTPSPELAGEAADKLGIPRHTVRSAGKVFGRTDAGAAQWLDMLRGEEVSNASTPDLGKVQQFLVSLFLVCVYAASIWAALSVSPPQDIEALPQHLEALPPLGEDFVWLMAVSHASYLAYKAAPHGSATGAVDSAAGDEAVG